MLLEVAGWLQVGLAVAHVGFPRYFRWREELQPLSLINRQLMQVHTFFVALVVGLLGVLCITSAPALAGTALGRRVCLGMAIFWLVRLVVQFGWYSTELWRGKRFETIVHVIFSAMWLFLTIVFGRAYGFG